RAGRLRFELRKTLVVAQVALSLLLLVGAGLFLRSLRNAFAIDVGLNTEHVLLASMNPDLNGYMPERVENFYQQLLTRLRDLPGVKAVAVAQMPLLSGGYNQVGMIVAGRPLPPSGPERGILLNKIGGDFFAATGSAILRGRDFSARDTAASPKAVI